MQSITASHTLSGNLIHCRSNNLPHTHRMISGCRACLVNRMSDTNKKASSRKGKTLKQYNLSFKKEVIAYAEIYGNRPASRRFSVDERSVREWRATKSNIEGLLRTTATAKQRCRLGGGGRKPLSPKLEEVMLEFIESRRSQGLRLSCKLIMKKAEVAHLRIKENNLVDGGDFKASRGWLYRFMKRNGLSLRRRTSIAH